MVSQTNEQALETCIETALVEGARYEKGDPADFDREFAILEVSLKQIFGKPSRSQTQCRAAILAVSMAGKMPTLPRSVSIY